MDYKDFCEAVFKKLHEEGYAPHKSDDELREAMAEYQDIMEDGYSEHGAGPRGMEHSIEYAAWNIAMCI